MSETGLDKVHQTVIREVISEVNSAWRNPFVLKGGSSLAQCYGLDRLSADIGLDAPGSTTSRALIFNVIGGYCSRNGYECRIAKNTDTVGRVFVNYEGTEFPTHPLKIEVSYRNATIDPSNVRDVGGIKVYDIDTLCQMKCAAYLSRDKIRDLYDLVFICTRYPDRLSLATDTLLRNSFAYKGLDQFDYLVATSDDMEVDEGVLETRFLETYEILGLTAEGEARRHGPSHRG